MFLLTLSLSRLSLWIKWHFVDALVRSKPDDATGCYFNQLTVVFKGDSSLFNLIFLVTSLLLKAINSFS